MIDRDLNYSFNRSANLDVMNLRNVKNRHDKIELHMTPMIDIVFQLLVFFIMTFKIVEPEGDFRVKMPLAAQQVSRPDDIRLPPIRVRLRADGQGNLSSILMNDQSLENFDALRLSIANVIDDPHGPGGLVEAAEVEVDCDYGLKYAFVIQAISSISGYVTETGNVVKLVEKIKFAPPRKSE